MDFDDAGSYLVVATTDGTVFEYARYCTECETGYYYDSVNDICKFCFNALSGCAVCKSATSCVQCI